MRYLPPTTTAHTPSFARNRPSGSPHRHERLVPLAARSKPHVMLWMQSYLLLAYGIGVQELRDRAAGLDGDGAAVPCPGFERTGLRSWIAHSTGGDDLE